LFGKIREEVEDKQNEITAATEVAKEGGKAEQL